MCEGDVMDEPGNLLSHMASSLASCPQHRWIQLSRVGSCGRGCLYLSWLYSEPSIDLEVD